MITLDCNQLSKAWLDAHIGIPTASSFSKIITPVTMKYSKSSDDYLYRKVAEWMLQENVDDFDRDWLERGLELEPQAINRYQFERDVTVRRVGFCMTDDRSAGCSPDGLIDDDPDGPGGLEIKCPLPGTHVRYLAGDVSSHKPQVQGSMWITGRQWWDFLSYHPQMPPALIRFKRDEVYIAAIASCLAKFTEQLRSVKTMLAANGYGPEPAAAEVEVPF